MDNIRRLEQLCGEQGIFCERDVPLRERTTFRIGGAADLVAQPSDEEQVIAVLRAAEELGVRLLTLGKGSNMLCADAGLHGAVLQLGKRFSALRDEGGGLLFCEAGMPLKQLCEAALERSLTGLEFAYGIPGSVGGAVYMNAGAYGGEMKDVLVRSRYARPDGGTGVLEGEAQRLAYRHSAYTDENWVITGAWVQLRPGNADEIRAAMQEYMRRRRDKQPLEHPSAGSTFRRPQGNYASALIDQCGLKGLRVGGACVSEKHAGFVVNDKGATCAEVRELIGKVQEIVEQQTGYRLECEVKIVE